MPNPAGDPLGALRTPRIPKCSRCRNHGVVVPVRGHSGQCAWKSCSCPKCSLITERHKIMAAHKQLRRAGPGGGQGEPGSAAAGGHTEPAHKPSEEGATGDRRQETGTPVLLQECIPKSEYFERDVSRMYLNCPPLYHYPPLFAPPAVNPPRFRGSPCSAGIPIRSFRQYQPLSIQDAGTDFRPNYYPTVPQFIPPGLMPGIHYLPPPLPMSVSMMAEPSRDMLGHMTAENQCMRPVLDKSQNKEPCA
ncbi:doublesex- and mab-3-related transcription factor B1 [Pelobates cultripes]|uniref:Doublesex- and mab-3-related transcription factor B1 n=1 Tax=Pelobates cultripes TaxID=61616 RepID=A0AAD1SSN3_PELCU|nr:doublesex- and mab-3-related transcription factor B1 [Pelobates cultripes]